MLINQAAKTIGIMFAIFKKLPQLTQIAKKFQFLYYLLSLKYQQLYLPEDDHYKGC